MSFLKFLIGIPLIVIIAVTAFMNNDVVTLNLWPFYVKGVQVSMSVIIVVLSVMGYLIGKIDSWMSYAPMRLALSSSRRQNKRLNAEQQKLVEKVEGLKENLENIKSGESNYEKAPQPDSLKQKILGVFKKNKPKQDDFW
ncbi:MAG: LapA family protein [Alphaproteobacteria bacterium]|nr:LapA family protein [Alphaproteobacteria bacterium]